MEVKIQQLQAQCGAIAPIPDTSIAPSKGFYLCTIRENSSTEKKKQCDSYASQTLELFSDVYTLNNELNHLFM